jgi:lysophospholipase L1-like esterase
VSIAPRFSIPCLAAALLLSACGSDAPPSTGPTSTAPQIACPLDMTVTGVTASAQAVTYSAPTVSGGAAPVNTTCSPASGASFPLGTTSVNCAASDAQARQATCSFKVTLKGMSLAVTTYDAFGDSLTQGETGRPNIVVPQFIDTPNSYPTKLQASFDATYPGQAKVINQGNGGDTVETTLAKIKQRVPVDRPGAVLLLAGFNNLTNVCATGLSNTKACGDAIDQVKFGIRDCMRAVKEANAGVKYTFVSTLTPPGASGSNRIDPNAIVQANAKLGPTIAAEGGILVDSYAAFVGHESTYVNVDGLHLQPAGYQALADTFFASIQKTIPQTPLFGFTVPR